MTLFLRKFEIDPQGIECHILDLTMQLFFLGKYHFHSSNNISPPKQGNEKISVTHLLFCSIVHMLYFFPKSLLNNITHRDITYRYSYERWIRLNIVTFTNANLNAKADFHKVF